MEIQKNFIVYTFALLFLSSINTSASEMRVGGDLMTEKIEAFLTKVGLSGNPQETDENKSEEARTRRMLTNYFETLRKFSPLDEHHLQLNRLYDSGITSDISISSPSRASWIIERKCEDENKIERSMATIQDKPGSPICINLFKLMLENPTRHQVFGMLVSIHARHYGLEDTLKNYHPLAIYTARRTQEMRAGSILDFSLFRLTPPILETLRISETILPGRFLLGKRTTTRDNYHVFLDNASSWRFKFQNIEGCTGLRYNSQQIQELENAKTEIQVPGFLNFNPFSLHEKYMSLGPCKFQLAFYDVRLGSSPDPYVIDFEKSNTSKDLRIFWSVIAQ